MSNPGLVRKIADSPAGSTGEVSHSTIIAQGEKNRNFIINGNFDVWQRGTTMTWTVNGYYYERWFSGQTGSNEISRRSATGLAGSTYCLRITYAGGTSNINDFYYMEDRDVEPLKGKTVTWSMYVRRSGSLNNGWALRVFKNATANTRTGGSWVQIGSNQVYTDSQIGSDWTLVSFTFDVPNDGTANGLRLNIVNINNIATNGVYFEVAQMMLNIGTERAPFSLYGGNLAGEIDACRRFYQRIKPGTGAFFGAGVMENTSRVQPHIYLPVPTRTNNPSVSIRPSISDFGIRVIASSVACTSGTIGMSGTDDVAHISGEFNTGSAPGGAIAGGAGHLVNHTGNAYIEIDAEFS